MLRPTFMGFETAKRGLTAAQKGLDVAGQNLTNWDSAGYTRQRITQVAIAPDSYRSRYSVSRVGPARVLRSLASTRPEMSFLISASGKRAGTWGIMVRLIRSWQISRLPSMNSIPTTMWGCVPAC